MQLELEAAQIIEGRIAVGRPPPEVFQAAAARRAARGPASEAWYRSTDAPVPGPSTPAATSAPSAAPARRQLAPAAGADLVLRVVQLPLAAAPPAASRRRQERAPRLVVEASN